MIVRITRSQETIWNSLEFCPLKEARPTAKRSRRPSASPRPRAWRIDWSCSSGLVTSCSPGQVSSVKFFWSQTSAGEAQNSKKTPDIQDRSKKQLFLVQAFDVFVFQWFQMSLLRWPLVALEMGAGAHCARAGAVGRVDQRGGRVFGPPWLRSRSRLRRGWRAGEGDCR